MSGEQSPFLQEHQKPEASTNPEGYSPSPEERKAIRLVERKFERAKKHRAKYDKNWATDYRFFRGKQWKDARPSYRHAEVINFVFQTIQSQVPILTDAKQRIEYVAQEPSDTEFAKVLDEVAESDWQAQNWTYKLAEMIYEGHIYGTGLGGLCYNPDALFGQGRIEFASEDPFYCFPDPNATAPNEKCRSFVIAKPRDVDELKRDYPEKAKFIKADLLDLVNQSQNRQEMSDVRYQSPADNRVFLEGAPSDLAGGENQALEITLYVFDHESIEETEEPSADPAQPPTKTQRLKYPNGRKICVASGVLLSDGPMDLDEPLMPFIRFVNYIDPRNFWGISEIEQLKGPQNIFNKVYSFVLDVLTMTGNPIWVVGSDAGVDTDNLINRPGLAVEADDINQVRREPGAQLQPYVLQILDRVREYIDSVAGSQEVSRGVRPEGITAASAIQSLQEAAQTRIRQKSRNLDATLQEFGILYKSYALSKYDAPRVFRLTNQEGAQKYFKFHVEKRVGEDGSEQKVGIVRPYNQDQSTGQFAESLDAKEYLIRGDFDVRVTTGSSLPFAKDAKFAKARQMFLDGVIDDEEYLKQAEYPNWQVVLDRVNQKKAAQQEAEMAAKMGAAPPGAAPPPEAGPPPAA